MADVAPWASAEDGALVTRLRRLAIYMTLGLLELALDYWATH